MRKALIVGIDHYEHLPRLWGCVSDAYSVKSVLERHGDGTINFGARLLAGTGLGDTVCRDVLKDAARDLFTGDAEVALFYFAGHGWLAQEGGYLVTAECRRGDAGLSLEELIALANRSQAQSKVVILDSCHSGVAGTAEPGAHRAVLAEGVTILTASTEAQYASEAQGSGVFTRLLVDALGGSAANLVGDVTPGSVYAHIDQSLGPWEQRPLFKTNVKHFVSLRKVPSPIPLADLRALRALFPAPETEFGLDPSFEPESPAPIAGHVAQFKILQRCNRVGLVTPVGTPHMYYAAMESRGCRLTVLGQHFWGLVHRNRI